MEIKSYNVSFGTKISKDLQKRLLSEAAKVRCKTMQEDLAKKLFMFEKSASDNSELVAREFLGIEYFFLDTKLGDKNFSTKVSQSKKISLIGKFFSIKPKDISDAEINNFKHIIRK